MGDEPGPKLIYFNHTGPNNMLCCEGDHGSYCIKTFCEYDCQCLLPDGAYQGKS